MSLSSSAITSSSVSTLSISGTQSTISSLSTASINSASSVSATSSAARTSDAASLLLAFSRLELDGKNSTIANQTPSGLSVNTMFSLPSSTSSINASVVLSTMTPSTIQISTVAYNALNIEGLQKMSDNGDSRAEYEMALRYEKGIGIVKHDTKAFLLYDHVAQTQARRLLGTDLPTALRTCQQMMRTDTVYQDFADAVAKLSHCYEKGRGVQQDVPKAVLGYFLASLHGSAFAAFKLGRFYEKGVHVPKSLDEAARLYTKAADLGWILAQIKLAKWYEQGYVVPKNSEKAFNLLLSATQRGKLRPKLFVKLGLFYEEGFGIAKQAALAAEAYKKAGENPAAQFYLARLMMAGFGVKQDPVAAIRLLQAAASQNYGPAILYLAFCLATGTGVLQDPWAADELLSKATQGRHTAAKYNLGFFYPYGSGVREDGERLEQQHSISTTEGCPEAQYFLGVSSRYGFGPQKPNAGKAVELYQYAASRGYHPAECSLAYCYENGIGVGQNLQLAIGYYKTAASHGNAFAQFWLATRYEAGKDGLIQDLDKARDLYYGAACQGHPEAQKRLLPFYLKERDNVIKNEAPRAAALFKSLAEQNYQLGQFYYAHCLATGTGVVQDVPRAAKLFRQVVDGGFNAETCKTSFVKLLGEKSWVDDQAKAIEAYIPTANGQDPEARKNARFVLNFCYSNGIIVEKDLVAAAKWKSEAQK